MFTETLTDHDDVIGLACEGKLSISVRRVPRCVN